MKKVVCINDKKLPLGAEIIKNKEYSVESEFIIEGIVNEGRTKMGLPWKGYNANRFADIEALVEESFEYSYELYD